MVTDKPKISAGDRIRRFMAEHSALFILAGLCVALGIYSDSFRSADNLQSVAQRTPVVGILKPVPQFRISALTPRPSLPTMTAVGPCQSTWS